MRLRSMPRRLYKISLMREDLPDPDTPVTQVKVPRGKVTSSPSRLFSAAPRITRLWPLPARRWAGTGMLLAPERYWPVMDSGTAMISSAVPAATTSPPWTPALGPMSMI